MFARSTVPTLHVTWRHLGAVVLAVMGLVLLAGCSTVRPRGHLLGGKSRRSLTPSLLGDSTQSRSVSSLEAEGSAGGLFGREADAFQVVQESCGLEEAFRHPAGGALYMGQARQLWERLVKTRVTQRSFAPRLVLSWLLRGVLARGERVDYAELRQRTERLWPLVMVRPDGYLVGALNGHPLQRLGKVRLVAGEMKVGSLVVGAFYSGRWRRR
jgi:hypothetical protein